MASTTNSSMTNDLGQIGHEMKDKAQEAAGKLADKAKDLASATAQHAGDAATTLGKKAEDATAAVGSGMQSLAGTLREKAPENGVLGSASAAVARSLDHGGRYLKEEGLQGIGDDLTNLIRRNPIPAVLLGIGVGYLLARATRS